MDQIKEGDIGEITEIGGISHNLERDAFIGKVFQIVKILHRNSDETVAAQIRSKVRFVSGEKTIDPGEELFAFRIGMKKNDE